MVVDQRESMRALGDDLPEERRHVDVHRGEAALEDAARVEKPVLDVDEKNPELFAVEGPEARHRPSRDGLRGREPPRADRVPPAVVEASRQVEGREDHVGLAFAKGGTLEEAGSTCPRECAQATDALKDTLGDGVVRGGGPSASEDPGKGKGIFRASSGKLVAGGGGGGDGRLGHALEEAATVPGMERGNIRVFKAMAGDHGRPRSAMAAGWGGGDAVKV